jgi:hypothetical protein
MPIYHTAVKAVNDLSQGDVTELNGFKTATASTALVAQALCLFFSVAPKRIRAQTAKE